MRIPSSRTSRSWFDGIVGAAIAFAAGLYLVGLNLRTVTNADALFLPAFFDDIFAHGLRNLTTWHGAPSLYVFPDVVLFGVLWSIFPHFQTAIPAFGGAVAALTVAVLWQLTGRGRSFAVFSAVFVAALGLILTCTRAAGDPWAVHYWLNYAAVSGHHYGTLLNSLLALALYFCWRDHLNGRRLALMGLFVVLATLSDPLFLPAGAAPLAAQAALAQWRRLALSASPSPSPSGVFARWSGVLVAAIVVASSVLAFVLEAHLNPRSSLGAGPTLASWPHIRESLATFWRVSSTATNDRVESLVTVGALVACIVLAIAWRRTSAAVAPKGLRSEVGTFAIFAAASSLVAAIVTGRYQGYEAGRYLQAYGLLPVLVVVASLASRVQQAREADGTSRLRSWPQHVQPWAPYALAPVGFVLLFLAMQTDAFASVIPTDVRCAERLGLRNEAGLVPYWEAKPLVVFGERHFQALQVDPNGAPYDVITNERWFAENWFGSGPPHVRFAVMSSAAQDDGRVLPDRTLDPNAIRRWYGDPDSIVMCDGAKFWLYRDDQTADLEPLPREPVNTMPIRLRAKHGQFVRGKAIESNGSIESTGDDGAVLIGPFIGLSKGRYRVKWYGARQSSEGVLSFDASVFTASLAIFATHDVALSDVVPGPLSARLTEFEFELDHDTPAVELRVFARNAARARLDSVLLESASEQLSAR